MVDALLLRAHHLPDAQNFASVAEERNDGHHEQLCRPGRQNPLVQRQVVDRKPRNEKLLRYCQRIVKMASTDARILDILQRPCRPLMLRLRTHRGRCHQHLEPLVNSRCHRGAAANELKQKINRSVVRKIVGLGNVRHLRILVVPPPYHVTGPDAPVVVDLLPAPFGHHADDRFAWSHRAWNRLPNVIHPDVPQGGLIHRLNPQNVGQVGHSLQDLLHRSQVRSLQDSLQRLVPQLLGAGVMVDSAPIGILIRSKFVAGEKDREHRGADQPVVVLRPFHVRHRHHIVNLAVQKTPTRFMELRAQLETAQLQRPTGCSIAPGPPRPAVLMGIQNDDQAKSLAPLDHLSKVVQVLLIIVEDSLVLHSLPCEQQSNKGVAPCPESRKMGVQLVQRRRTTNEGHITVASVEMGIFSTGESRRLEFRDSR
mmetsp:Transcript_88605/g.236896  ORF Transcript_88605/g.236896 Transcript_88605/m.236896 type:complete len:425 (+) Transcript_88605:734-2008(+)